MKRNWLSARNMRGRGPPHYYLAHAVDVPRKQFILYPGSCVQTGTLCQQHGSGGSDKSHHAGILPINVPGLIIFHLLFKVHIEFGAGVRPLIGVSAVIQGSKGK